MNHDAIHNKLLNTHKGCNSYCSPLRGQHVGTCWTKGTDEGPKFLGQEVGSGDAKGRIIEVMPAPESGKPPSEEFHNGWLVRVQLGV